MNEMTAGERHAFLLDGAKTASLATVRPDGSPHVAPIWFDLDHDDTVVFTTAETSVKEEYGERNAVPGELLVRVRATRAIGRAGITD